MRMKHSTIRGLRQPQKAPHRVAEFRGPRRVVQDFVAGQHTTDRPAHESGAESRFPQLEHVALIRGGAAISVSLAEAAQPIFPPHESPMAGKQVSKRRYPTRDICKLTAF